MRSAPFAAALLLGAMPAAAQEVLFDGRDEYRVTLNAHGAVLGSNRATLYLGRACDAWSPQHGRGRWEWANGGVLVHFARRTIAFARQEVPADPDGRCRA